MVDRPASGPGFPGWRADDAGSDDTAFRPRRAALDDVVFDDEPDDATQVSPAVGSTPLSAGATTAAASASVSGAGTGSGTVSTSQEAAGDGSLADDGVDALLSEDDEPVRWWHTRAAKALVASLIGLVLVLAAMVGFYWMRVNRMFDDIHRNDYAPQGSNRPMDPMATGPQAPMTVVLMGADQRVNDSGRSDSLMVAYLPADRKHVYLLSVPRDSYVEIPGHGKSKINAAYSLGGPPLTMATLEHLLDVKMQHAAVINFENFIRLTDVLGGVEVDNPEASFSNAYNQDFRWPKGKITVKGQEALAFVQIRHGLSQGDLTRAARQRAVIQGIVKKTLSLDVIGNPVTFNNLMEKTSGLVEVDKEMTTDVIRNTAFGLANIRPEDIRGLQLPLKAFDTVSGAGSVDLVDTQRLAELQDALQHDTMDAYYDKHKNDPLVGAAPSDGSAQPSATPTKKRKG